MSQAADIRKAFKAFGEALVAKARRNLKITRKRQGKTKKYNSNATASGKLGKSIAFDFKVYESLSAELSVEMLEYGVVLNDGRGKTRSGGNGSVKDALVDWIKDKRIKPRDANGKFIKATPKSIKSLAYVMARSIHERGYDKAPFFDEALMQTRKEQDAIPAAYGSHLQREIERSFKSKGFK